MMLVKIGNTMYSEEGYKRAIDPLSKNISQVQPIGENECIITIDIGYAQQTMNIKKSAQEVVKCIEDYNFLITEVFKELSK